MVVRQSTTDTKGGKTVYVDVYGKNFERSIWNGCAMHGSRFTVRTCLPELRDLD